MASIKHLITVQLTHSFVCLLNVFPRPLPCSHPTTLPPTSPLVGPVRSPSPHHRVAISQKRPRVTRRGLTGLDWARHAQSILSRTVSDITLALTKQCECSDGGNDTGHIRTNENQHSSPALMAALHSVTSACYVCVCVKSDEERCDRTHTEKNQKENVHEQEVAGKMRGGVNDQRPDDHGAKKKG